MLNRDQRMYENQRSSGKSSNIFNVISEKLNS